MRILYISDSSIASTSPNSVHVMKMCQAFSLLGHNVELWGKNTTACLRNVSNVFAFYAVKNSFKLHIYPLRPFRGSGNFYNLSLIWRLFFLSEKELIYTRSITAAFLLAFYRKPFVFEVHEPYEGKGRRLRWMFRFVLHSKYLRKLTVISDALKHYYTTNFSATNILVAHDSADAASGTEPVIQDSTFKVGYVGSLLPGKGIEILLPLAGKCRSIVFHIVGGSQQQIEKLKREHPELHNVFFHGFKSQQEIPAYVQSFDVLIAPYLNDVRVNDKREANNLALWMSPLKIFEYMSAGKPIVATDLPVIREILQDKVTALLCNASILAEWETALHKLKENGELRNQLAQRALEKFEREHTWLQRAQRILTYV